MRYVICVRNPIDVARSLAQRDDLPFNDALRLWLVHNATALTLTHDQTRTLISYEALIANPQSVAARLAGLIGYASAIPHLADIVATDLQHHRTTFEATMRDERLPQPVRAFYAAVCSPEATRESDACVELGAAAGFAGHTQATLDPTFGRPRPVLAARRYVRQYLADRAALGGLYRGLRRSFRRAFRLGP